MATASLIQKSERRSRPPTTKPRPRPRLIKPPLPRPAMGPTRTMVRREALMAPVVAVALAQRRPVALVVAEEVGLVQGVAARVALMVPRPMMPRSIRQSAGRSHRNKGCANAQTRRASEGSPLGTIRLAILSGGLRQPCA